MNARFFEEMFNTAPVMIILRGQAPREAVDLANRIWDIGLHSVEVPVHTPEAFEALEAVIGAGIERGMKVGAGTVVSVEQVDKIAAVGGSYTVSPGLDMNVARASSAAGMPHLPGVATATEVQQALANGLIWVKAFPAVSLGPSWFRSIRGPFPEAKLVATGGLHLRDVDDFLAAGASGVGLGSVFDDPTNIERLAHYSKSTKRPKAWGSSKLSHSPISDCSKLDAAE